MAGSAHICGMHGTSIVDFRVGGRRVFQRPLKIITTHVLDEVVSALAEAETYAKNDNYVVGFVSYEAAPAFDPCLEVGAKGPMPLVWFAVYRGFSVGIDLPVPTARSAAWHLRPAREDFITAVERIREEIASGRTYQVNLSVRLVSEDGAGGFARYQALRRAQGPGYHAFIDTGDFSIASVSPELFFARRGATLETRPMKGTRARGRFNEEDAAIEHELQASGKDRAENLMIVDLLRNDLGRIAKVGTVRATSLFDVERYRTVVQMTSRIEARLPAACSLAHIFSALFPSGSVTGAPKISTMRLIGELEREPREVYCGAVGMIEPGGDCVFNVPIRTLWTDHTAGRTYYGTGAGITFDSDPHAEFREIIAKAAVLTEEWPRFELLETMRIGKGGIVRFERHLKRLLESARYFGIALTEEDLRTHAARASGDGMLRLLVDENGKVRSELLPLTVPDNPRFGIAGEAIDSSNRFLYHKTTHRGVYDAKLAQHPDCWDVLLWNERGQVTEFCRGNVVLELDGERLTPARDCGLLAGTLRAELIEQGWVREEIIPVGRLGEASRIFFVNSLRGVIALAGAPLGPSPSLSVRLQGECR